MSIVTQELVTVRRPTAAPRSIEEAPAFTVGGPIAGRRVGLRHEGSWRSWMWIVAEWPGLRLADGADPVVLAPGGRVGSEGVRTRADVAEWASTIDCGISGLG